MSGLFYRVRLLLSFVVFLLQLGVVVGILPYKSFILATLFATWIGICSLTTLARPEILATTPDAESPLFSLLAQDFSRAGFAQSKVLPVEVRKRQQIWESQRSQLPISRDFLLNGALLYFSLGDTTKAQELYKAAWSTDPNNPLFKLQLDQFFQ